MAGVGSPQSFRLIAALSSIASAGFRRSGTWLASVIAEAQAATKMWCTQGGCAPPPLAPPGWVGPLPASLVFRGQSSPLELILGLATEFLGVLPRSAMSVAQSFLHMEQLSEARIGFFTTGAMLGVQLLEHLQVLAKIARRRPPAEYLQARGASGLRARRRRSAALVAVTSVPCPVLNRRAPRAPRSPATGAGDGAAVTDCSRVREGACGSHASPPRRVDGARRKRLAHALGCEKECVARKRRRLSQYHSSPVCGGFCLLLLPLSTQTAQDSEQGSAPAPEENALFDVLVPKPVGNVMKQRPPTREELLQVALTPLPGLTLFGPAPP